MSLKNSLLNLNIANEMYQTTLEHDLSPPPKFDKILKFENIIS
jgi:hypothetical protein